MAALANPSEMTGREKAAILCMALGAEVAAKVTAQLTPDEAEVISFEIARVDQVPAERVDVVLAEWVESVVAADVAGGGVDFAREVLEKAFGSQRAGQILKRIQGQLQESAGLQRLRKADPQQLVNTLRGEHPQTLALILSHLQPAQTAAILKELDPALGGEVVFRMARMEKVSPDMLNLIERSLAAETELSMSQGMSASGGPAAVAQVLNLVHSTLEQQLLDGVEARDKGLSDQIKNLMFVFEDIATLDDRALQRLLREIEAKTLALSLKAASDELKAKIMGSMSQRAVGSLREEMEMMGPVKMRDVEAAQIVIVTQVRQLEESGEIVLSGGDDLVVG
jgi:flagellar motor switch protein FliG